MTGFSWCPRRPIFLSLVFLGACAGQGPARTSDHEPSLTPTVKSARAEIPAPDRRGVPESLSSPVFSWPVTEPRITAFFGWRSKKHVHEGIDVGARMRTEIFAAASGEIIFAGRIRRFGKIIMVDHGGGWSTVYAHLSKLKVKIGQKVRRGEVIALSGRTGRSSGPHLHFEIRKGSDPVDPLLFLPSAKWSQHPVLGSSRSTDSEAN